MKKYLLRLLFVSVSLSLVAPAARMQAAEAQDAQFNQFANTMSRYVTMPMRDLRALWLYGVKKVTKKPISKAEQDRVDRALARKQVSIGTVLAIITTILGLSAWATKGTYWGKSQPAPAQQPVGAQDKGPLPNNTDLFLFIQLFRSIDYGLPFTDDMVDAVKFRVNRSKNPLKISQYEQYWARKEPTFFALAEGHLYKSKPNVIRLLKDLVQMGIFDETIAKYSDDEINKPFDKNIKKAEEDSSLREDIVASMEDARKLILDRKWKSETLPAFTQFLMGTRDPGSNVSKLPSGMLRNIYSILKTGKPLPEAPGLNN